VALVCFVVGARPNFMKTASVLTAVEQLGVSTLLVHTGQHYDFGMSEIFIAELGLRTPDVFLGIGSGTHAEQTARALVRIEEVLIEERPDLVVVPGDVNSTLAGALAAVKLDIPVGHLEAGLRSFDRSMPEEHNRCLTDHMSDLLFVHSESAIENLTREGIDQGVAFVGNTMIDALLDHLDTARALRPWEQMGVEPGSYALVTLHRPSLVDDDGALERTVGTLVKLADALPVIFPIHPRTRGRLESTGLGRILTESRVTITEPLSYLAFLGLEADARVVITDSGGVQEETSALGVPCFTLRSSTERPVTVELGTNTILGVEPERMANVVELLDRPKRGVPIPLWDGSAGVRAARTIREFLEYE
jgi:UDP-N-acetylglucosamine 2-epimerase (non-hydrolysing)